MPTYSREYTVVNGSGAGKVIMRLPIACIVLLMSVLARAQAPAFRPLTDGSLRSAIAEGQGQNVTPSLDIVIGRINRGIYLDADGNRVGGDVVLAMIQRAPFYVTVMTPYQRVLSIVVEAKRRFTEIPTFSLAELNGEGVVFHVTEGGSFPNADVISDLVLKKGELVVRAAKKEIKPTTVQNQAGASKPGATGDFYFPIAAMPEAPFEVICIGASGNYRQTIVADDVEHWK
jgi:hypothetical protein